ncbi:MAG: VanZ family protein [Methyloprofundus sp.]|nr:VanZ family protein [Methyloprofundus sp.]
MPLIKSPKFLYFAIAYTAFIIYGSLVPLAYRAIPFDTALLAFQNIRYLDLGAGSRADWISNIVLYIPLGYSLSALLIAKTKSVFYTVFSATLILIFCLTLAVTIEFYQQFFPPRTVSQNDLIAEAMGSVIGLALWFGYGTRLQKLYTHILKGGREALLASAILYALAYLAISFFPYDFVTSLQELQDKLALGMDALFISSSCGSFIFCSTKLITEVFIVLPLGILLAVLLKWHPHRRTAVMLVGFIMGSIIEGVQLFLVSGIAQGLSILTRIVGLGLGELIYTKISHTKNPFITVNARKYLSIAFIPYLLLLPLLNGWRYSTQAMTFSIAEKIDKLNWLPFYYHYYTTEATALKSLLSVFAMYLPIGLGVWLWHYHKENSAHKLTAGLFALLLCLIMESGKLFFIGKHPDPTNLLISFAAAFISYALAELVYHWFHHPDAKQPIQAKAALPTHLNSKHSPALDRQTSSPLAKSCAIVIIAGLLWKALDYPGSSIGLIGMLLLYASILRKYSFAWLIVIPAALPILDFSPWTGRLFFSEFDYFVLLSFALSLWYGRWNSPLKIIKPGVLFLFALYTLLYIISLLQGLFPWQALDINAFTNYYSQYNALRVAKGLIWANLFLPLLAYQQYSHKDIKTYFTYGILTGLTLSVFCSLWERTIFTGLFDFSSDFRITSTFYSMHTGGAPLDAYLLLSIPFISLLLIQSKNILLRTLFIPLLFAISLYTLLVTYSRGSYIAFVFTLLILISGLFICYRQQITSHWKKLLWLPLFLLLTAIIATPVLKGSFIQHRFSQAHQAADTRTDHWLGAIAMMDSGIFTSLFGMGLGSFPRTYLWNHFSDQIPATFLLHQEKNDSYLQLGAGRPLYIEQIIKITANTRYNLSLDYRMNSAHSRLSISICEKAIQHSFNCQETELIPEQKQADWQHFTRTINTQNLSSNFRPIKLILRNKQPDSSIEIKNIALNSANKESLIQNGSFSKGMDHWFFTSDDHIPWRAENLWVQILFDQGWLGLISFMLILFYSVIYLCQQLLKQDYYAAITLSSLTGFFIVGIIDSPFDQAIISLLFFMIVYISLINPEHK